MENYLRMFSVTCVCPQDASSERVFRINGCEGALERGLCDREGNWHCADPHYPAINTLNDPQDDRKEILETAWPLRSSVYVCVFKRIAV